MTCQKLEEEIPFLLVAIALRSGSGGTKDTKLYYVCTFTSHDSWVWESVVVTIFYVFQTVSFVLRFVSNGAESKN